jgi:hypothetical protein
MEAARALQTIVAELCAEARLVAVRPVGRVEVSLRRVLPPGPALPRDPAAVATGIGATGTADKQSPAAVEATGIAEIAEATGTGEIGIAGTGTIARAGAMTVAITFATTST